MTSQAAYSATYLAIVAGGGFATGLQMAWGMAATTAALAFFAHEIHAATGRVWIANAFAITSWLTGTVAGLSLLF